MKRLIVPLIILILLSVHSARADEYTAPSFKVLDPVIQPANYATSGNFQLWSTLSEIALGISTTSLFQLGAGFLRFPQVSTPIVSATPGSNQVLLNWTASQGFLGLTPTTYSIAVASAPSGPYSPTNVGNTLSAIQVGLANGTLYYFVVIVNDAFGNPIATSTPVSAIPVANNTNNNGGGGTGGGGGILDNPTRVIFSGRAYPKSTVTLLQDAQVVASTVAGQDAKFSISLSGVTPGNYIYSVYSEDNNGLRSSLLSFPVSVTQGVTTNVGGIFITPTIDVDKSEVRRGDDIIIFGQTAPSSTITISINSAEEFFEKRTTDDSGVYLVNFDTSVLEMGDHHTKSKTALNGEVSSFSKVIGFIVGTRNVFAKDKKKFLKGDLNKDGRVNLLDFSIAAFWYKQKLSANFKVIEKERLNGDGRLDLLDFSIMAFYWTG